MGKKFIFLNIVLFIIFQDVYAKEKNNDNISQAQLHGYISGNRENKIRILNSIAEASYITLDKFRKNTLKDPNNIVNIIDNKKQLELTNKIMPRILAMCLQNAVDTVILNELYRNEINKHRLKSGGRKLNNNINDEVLMSLLYQNSIDEIGWISNAININPKVRKFCHDNNYIAKDFVNGRIFKDHPGKLKYEAIEKQFQNGKSILTKRNIDVRRVQSSCLTIHSKSMIKEVVLPLTLYYIDEARDIRCILNIYKKYGGFTDDLGHHDSVFYSDTFLNRLQNELMNKTHKHITSDNLDIPVSLPELLGNVRSRLYKDKRHSFQALFPFIINVNIFDENAREDILRLYNVHDKMIGIWLDLVN